MAALEQYEVDDSWEGFGSCSRVDIESFNNKTVSVSDSFGLFHLNIRSLGANGEHFGELLLYLDTLKFKFPVIVLTETWVTEENDIGFRIPGYNVYNYYSGRGGRH